MFKWFKYLVFLVATSTVMTALTDYVLPISIPNKEFIVSPILEAVYIMVILVFYKNYNFNRIENLKRQMFILVLPVFIAYFFEFFRYNVTPGRNVLSIAVNFLNILMFYWFFMFNVSLDRDFYGKAIKIYWGFNYFIALSAVFVFTMLHLHLLNLNSWGLPSFFSDNFHVKLDIAGAGDVYKVPLFITVIMTDYIKPFGFISEFGTFTGLSYEPHVATFFMTPAFFLTAKYYAFNLKNILIRFLPFILFFLLSFSATNILGLLIVGVFSLCFHVELRKLLPYVFGTFILIAIVLLFSPSLLNIFDLFQGFIDNKFESRSGDESVGFIKYVTDPKSFFGWGIFNIPTHTSTINANDIGLGGFFILVLLYFNIVSVSIKNLKRKNYIYTSIGIYVFIHSLKFPLHIFLYPYLVFLLFLMYYPLAHDKWDNLLTKKSNRQNANKV